MLSNQAISDIPLPRNWPRRVRSAVIHTISLAHASLTQARSVDRTTHRVERLAILELRAARSWSQTRARGALPRRPSHGRVLDGAARRGGTACSRTDQRASQQVP